MPPNPHPRCMKLLERHVECGPQLRTTAGGWGRRAPKFLVSRSKEICSASPCLFRGSRACAWGVRPLRFCWGIPSNEALICQVSRHACKVESVGLGRQRSGKFAAAFGLRAQARITRSISDRIGASSRLEKPRVSDPPSKQWAGCKIDLILHGP